jgi:hypothetical protein
MLEDLSDLGSDLHVDDAGASASLEAVLVDVGALADDVLRAGDDQTGVMSRPCFWHKCEAPVVRPEDRQNQL